MPLLEVKFKNIAGSVTAELISIMLCLNHGMWFRNKHKGSLTQDGWFELLGSWSTCLQVIVFCPSFHLLFSIKFFQLTYPSKYRKGAEMKNPVMLQTLSPVRLYDAIYKCQRLLSFQSPIQAENAGVASGLGLGNLEGWCFFWHTQGWLMVHVNKPGVSLLQY